MTEPLTALNMADHVHTGWAAIDAAGERVAERLPGAEPATEFELLDL